MRNYDLEVPISKKNESLVKENKRCISCGYCKRVCEDEMTVAKMYKANPKREPICINCGQCANVCPTESIHERFDYIKVKKILKSKKDKTVIFNIAPAVRVALSEEFGEKSKNIEGKIVTALKKLGADYVFDITFGADLTIMEEASEFVERLKKEKNLPQFTSCCPAWVKYAEIFYPKLLPSISTAKSPIAMQSTIIKTYFKEKIEKNVSDIINIVVAPCTAKKYEIKREELSYTKKDTDFVLTTRELALLLKEEKIDIMNLEDTKFDSPMAKGSSAGVLFGNSGGVCEATLRTAYYLLTGENLKKEDLVFTEIRGMEKIKEAQIKIGKKVIKVAVCNGIKSLNELLEKMKNKKIRYDFIEVMSCSGGCISGGGQPKVTLLEKNDVKNNRMSAIYNEDDNMHLRLCHENEEVKMLYDEYLGKPNSQKSKELLHTKYFDKSFMLGGRKNAKKNS